LAFLKRHQVASFVVGFAVNPASMEDADPLESEGSRGQPDGSHSFAVAR
jgi:hypothetical protein